jgi:predicted porin
MTHFFTFNFKDRASNTLQYDTPNLSGFKLSYQYGMSENQDKVTATTSGSQSAVTLTYDNGPLSLMGSQTIQRDAGIAANGGGVAAFAAAALGRTLKVNGFAGSYDFDSVKLMGQLWTEKTTEPNNAATAYDYRHWMLGVNVPYGAHGLLASYRVRDDGTVANQDSKSWTLGYNYTMSKRTTSYLRASTVSNSNNATAGFGGSAGVAAIGTKALQAGMYHTF